MSIVDAGVVDWLGVDKESGEVFLVLVDGLDWDDTPAHLSLLQAKLNAYLSFVESGEVYEQISSQFEIHRDGAPVRIDIIAKHPWPGHLARYLEHAQASVSGSGCRLTHRVRPPDPGSSDEPPPR